MKIGIFLQQPWQDVVCEAALGSLQDGVGLQLTIPVQNGAQESSGAETGSRKELGQGVVSQGCPKLP